MARQKFRPRGDLITSLRKRLKLKQAAIAADLGITDKTMRGIEKGTITIDHRRAMELAGILHIASWQDLVYGAKGPELITSRDVTLQSNDQDRLVPRYEKTPISLVTDAERLFADGCEVLTIVPHFLTALADETASYADEMVTILESIKRIDWGQPTALTKDDIAQAQQRLRQLYVLLKGNDVGIYADTHWKRIPESEVLPEKPSPLSEYQLIIAFAGMSDESVTVEVDNGHPYILPGQVSWNSNRLF